MGVRAVVIGESLVDLIGDEEDGEVVYRPRAGGSPLNVAVGLARLDIDVAFATAIAPDSFGTRMRRFLATEGVEVDAPADGRGGTCLAVVTRRGDDVEFEYFGDTATMLAIDRVSQARLAASAVVHASSTAFLDDPVLATVEDAFGRAAALRSADPNPRPFLIPDRARYLERLEAVLRLADLVKLSDEDAAYLYPGLPPDAVADHLLDLGPSTVLLTRAAAPSRLVTADGRRDVSTPEVDAVDPTGAGDSVSASLIADICQGGVPTDLDGWVAIVSRANVAASLTCTRVGGADSMPHRAALDERLALTATG